MAKRHSTKFTQTEKPYPGFPLTRHPQGYWVKKILGKTHYFGPRGCDWQTALAEFDRVKADLYAGKDPAPAGDSVTLKYVCNHFLGLSDARVRGGEMAKRTFNEYKTTAQRMLDALGDRTVSTLTPEDFAKYRESMFDSWGPVSVGNEVARVRVILKAAFDNELVDKPIRIGKAFKKPSKKTLRANREKKPPRLFAVEEVRAVLGSADPQLKAMILLGINAGYGNDDVARLEPRHIIDDWLVYPRPKTLVPRRCWIWPETKQAIQDVLERRKQPESAEYAHLIFITKYGRPWYAEDGKGVAISQAFRKLLIKHGIHRSGVNFYALRHTFATIASETKDQPAINLVMGHADDSMAAHYRETIGDDRLMVVSQHVRQWLYGSAEREVAL